LSWVLNRFGGFGGLVGLGGSAALGIWFVAPGDQSADRQARLNAVLVIII